MADVSSKIFSPVSTEYMHLQTSTFCFVLLLYLYCCNKIWIVLLIRNLIWTGELCGEVSCNFYLLLDLTKF